MYYRLWRRLYNYLVENDPENEIIRQMEIMETEKELDDLIESYLAELED